MPRLTQIKETKKGRLALFFDGEFAFSLDEQTFSDAALHQDDLLEDWQIEELRKKSETRRALDKAMDYLSLRDHAAGELYQKLCRRFDAHSAAYAVARAGELGLLNDAGFARRRAAELLRKRKDTYRRYRDLSIFAFIGVYLLSVIDAYVDAELSNFDITPDLSMKVEPAVIDNRIDNSSNRSVGLQCSFRF